MELYFFPIKKYAELKQIAEDLRFLNYDAFEEGKDKKNKKLFRLKDRGRKIGIIVIVNEALEEEVRNTIISCAKGSLNV